MPFATLLRHGLLYGVILSVALSLITMGSLYWDAEMWLHDYPQDIIEAHGPMGPRAVSRKRWVGALFLVALVAIVVWAIVALHRLAPSRPTFIDVALVAMIVYMMFNAVDLLILDWLIFVWIRPRWIVLPGTEGCEGYADYGYHLRAAGKGVVFSLIGALVTAALTLLVRAVFA